MTTLTKEELRILANLVEHYKEETQRYESSPFPFCKSVFTNDLQKLETLHSKLCSLLGMVYE